MASYLLDASALVKLVLPEPGSEEVDRLVSQAALGTHRVLVLDLSLAEAANALWKRHQRGELSQEQAHQALAHLLAVARRLGLVQALPRTAKALEMAIRLNESTYDCLYLAAAAHKRLTLVTADARQAQAARRLGGVHVHSVP